MKNNNTDDLVLNNLPLIKKCMKDMFDKGSLIVKSEEEFENVYFAGLLGLVQSASKYDPAKSSQANFFYICIRNSILHYFYLSSMKKRMLDKFIDISLDNRVYINDIDSDRLADFIEDERVNVEKEVENKIILEEILQDINNMKNQRNAEVIKMYHGLDGYKEMNFGDIGKALNVSKTMAHVRYHKGMVELKNKIESRGKNEFKNFKKNKKRF